MIENYYKGYKRVTEKRKIKQFIIDHCGENYKTINILNHRKFAEFIVHHDDCDYFDTYVHHDYYEDKTNGDGYTAFKCYDMPIVALHTYYEKGDYEDVAEIYMSKETYRRLYTEYKNTMKKSDKIIIESLVKKYGTKGVEVAISRLNEWNMWDRPKSDDFYSAAIRQAERNRPRLVDVVDKLPKRNHDAQRYKDDPEYHEHIRRLEAQLRKTTDPQEAEYLERRINKLKSLSE